jgi:hypothetical protein
VKAGSLISEMMAYLADKDKVKGTPTGIGSLDKLLGGGKREGEVTAWVALAKTGKNTLWHKQIHAWANQGIPMGYASRELTPSEEVLPNLMALQLQRNAWLNSPSLEENQVIEGWPLYFAEGYGYFPREDIARWMDNAQKEGVKHFWFDHLHYMLDDSEDFKEANSICRWLKTQAKERKIHIDIIIQPKNIVEGQALSINSMRGGAGLGQAIDNCIVLERVKGSDPKDIMKVRVDAVRSKLADTGEFFLHYNRTTTDFSEVTMLKDSEAPVSPGAQAMNSYGATKKYFTGEEMRI